MAKSAKRKAEQAFEEAASAPSKPDKLHKKNKKAKRDSAAEQLQLEDQQAKAEAGVFDTQNAPNNVQASLGLPHRATESQGALTEKQRRRERRRQKKNADREEGVHPTKEQEGNQALHGSSSTAKKRKKNKTRKSEADSTVVIPVPNVPSSPSGPKSKKQKTEEEDSIQKHVDSGDLIGKKKKKKSSKRSRTNKRDRKEPNGHGDVAEAAYVTKLAPKAAPDAASNGDVSTDEDDGGMPIEASPAKKKKRSRNQKVNKSTPGAWSLTSSAGFIFIDHDPILTSDDEHLILPTRFDVRVYARSTSLLLRLLQIRLNDDHDKVVSCALSKSTPSHLYIATSHGSVFLFDWTSGHRIMRWHSKGLLSQLVTLQSQVLAVSHQQGAKESTIDTRTLDMSNSRQGLGFELLKRADLNPNIHYSEDANVLVATARNRLLLGWCKDKATAQFEWRELRVPGGIASFDVRAFMERKSVGTPHVDVAVGSRSGEIMVYENLLFKMIGREKQNQSLDISARILHWHRRAVNTVKWSRDGNYLISGGRETVLVIWQLDTNQQQFLPHLSSEIISLSISPKGSAYSVRLADNSVMILSSANLDVVANIAGLASAFHPQAKLVASLHPSSSEQLLLATPRDSIRPGFPAYNLQTYDLHTDRELAKQALTRNATTIVSTSGEGQHIEPNVTHLRLSADGRWLATVEEWMPDPSDLHGITLTTDTDSSDFGMETCLKIWLHNEAHGDWELVNRIDNPHSAGSCRVLALESNPSRAEFATAGEDGELGTWRPKARVRDGVPVKNETGEQLYNWSRFTTVSCTSETDKRYNTAVLAYPSDGSVIAASWSRPASSWEPRWTYLIDTEKSEKRASTSSLLTHGPASLAFSDQYLVCLSREFCIFDTVSSVTLYRAPLDTAYQGAKSQRFLSANALDGTVAVAINKADGKDGTLAVTKPSAIKISDAETRSALLFESSCVRVKALLSSPSSRGYVVIDNNGRISNLKRSRTAPPAEASVVARHEKDDLRKGLDRIFGCPLSNGATPANGSLPRGIGDNDAAFSTALDLTEGNDRAQDSNTKSLDQVVYSQNTASVLGVREMFGRVVGWFAGSARTGSDGERNNEA
jgi:NET1-associated nuclear protein 1 (U3 small nucleolar RNA-associated protein 17)